MKKMIYADDLQAQLSRKKPEVCRERYIEGFNDALMRFKSMIHSAKAVDAVPVVRCRECKHYKSNAGLGKSCFHDLWNQEFAVPTAPDDFCSYGERKDGGVESEN